MRRAIPSCAALAACLVLVFVSASPRPALAVDSTPAAGAESGSLRALAAPDLRVEQVEGAYRLLASVKLSDGSEKSSVIAESAEAIEILASGRAPAGDALFARFSVAGEARPMVALARGAALEWGEARPLDEALRLRDASVLPGEPLPSPRAGFAASEDARVFVVQFATRSIPEWRATLEEFGAEVLGFLPHAAHVVRVDPARVAAIKGLDFVARVDAYHPWYRLSPEVRDWLDGRGSDEERRRVRVMAFEWGESGKRRIVESANALGAEVAAFWSSGHVVELFVDRAQLRALSSHDDVAWIDPWSPREVDMDLVREDAGVNQLENETGFCGTGVRAEVMDNGVQDDHPDFDGIILNGATSVASHGTNTYGIVFGNGDRDGDGSAKGLGHMPCAQGIFADYDSLGDRFAHTQALKESPYFASFQTNSWGNARTRAYNSISADMDDIIWRLDFAILQSQSNAGNQDSRPQAWAKNIISVGGIRHRDTLDTSDDAWSNGASIGPAEDGRIKPDVNYWYDNIYTTTTGSGYTSTFGGTSAATPESAGVLGLLIEMWSENVFGTEPEGGTVFERQPSAQTMKALLINTAVQYPFAGQSDDLTRVHQGWGRPNAYNAYERAPASFIVDEEINLLFDETAQFEIDVAPGEAELKITMAYPDPPGNPGASLHRINDVDVKVTSPSGAVYHGNVGLLESPYSTPGGSPNGVDTVENVFVENPESGTWIVEVRAAEVNEDAVLDTPESDLTFALVVTGASGQICEPPTADFTADPNPARVGDEVFFDSNASGGAGAPYSYSWDFESDGEVDAETEDATNAYARPFDELVTLTVADAEGCRVKVEKPMSVTGPDLRYGETVDLVEVEGNFNGSIDPGETWDFRVRMDNIGSETAVGVQASVVLDPSTAGPVTLLADTSSYPDVIAGGSENSTSSYRFRVGNDFPCGNDVVLSLVAINSDDPANAYPDEPRVIRLLVGGAGDPVDFLEDGFESDSGWSFVGEGEWEIGAPQGLGGGQSLPGDPQPSPDPASAYAGAGVLGNDLTGLGVYIGNYEGLISSTATSPALDTSVGGGVTMSFARWLNVYQNDAARVQVSRDGQTWRTLWEAAGESVFDQSWQVVSYDVSEEADGNPNFRVRFQIEADGIGQLSGWNVDDLVFNGVTRDSCEPFAATGSPGESNGLRVEKEAGGSLLLSWGADCGFGSAYGVYRGDLAVGLSSMAPEPGLCSVGDTSVSVDAGAGAADFFLVVPNDGGGEGSYGVDAQGGTRAPASGACLPQDVVDSCAR